MSDQLGLFGTPDTPTETAASRACPPPRAPRTRITAGNPVVARDVLAEVADRRYGFLDDTDRVMVFEEPERVRLALDEDSVHTLISSGYVERAPSRDIVTAHHGAIRRLVQPLRLTQRGRSLLVRWSSYRPLTARMTTHRRSRE